MQRDDHELEKYLSEFRPRAVRPLEVRRPAAKVWIGRLTAAAVVLFSVGGELWYARHEAKSRTGVNMQTVRRDSRTRTSGPNSILLTKLALENDRQFEVELEAESRRVLPDFREQQSTLHVFTGE